MPNLIVKTNYLNTVLQNLSLVEVRIIQLAIIDARDSGNGLSPDKPLRISAERYASAFGTSKDNAYKIFKEASVSLLRRYFSFINPRNNLVMSNWVTQIEYFDGAGEIELIFTPAVVQGISRIDGAVDFFTKYLLSNTINFKSVYSVRLYELMAQWKNATKGKTPIFELQQFRGQLGVEPDEYTRMSDFKTRVLEVAIAEINEHSDLTISYEQHKRGRKITGFSFKITAEDKNKITADDARDLDTLDMFYNLTDKQIHVYSRKLAHMPELAHLGEVGESYDDLADKIAIALKDDEKQAFFRPYLLKLGFKASF